MFTADGFAQALKKGRERTGMNQRELAETLNVSRGTVMNWESGRSCPDAPQLALLCGTLGMSANELLGLGGTQDLTAEERRLVSWFRGMSDTGRKTALAAIRAASEAEQKLRYKAAAKAFPLLPFWTTPAAAGCGNPFADTEPEYRRVRVRPHSDGVVTVRGDSMLPAFRDGDKVYVRLTDNAEPGDIAVCATADGAVIKLVTEDRRLRSLNPEYPYPERYEDDHVRVLGTVLGKVTEQDYPNAEEVEILRQGE